MYGPWVRVPAGSLRLWKMQGLFFMPHMYVIYSQKLDKYYVGACTDLERRLYEHNIGHSKYTSLGVPWVVKYKEEFETLLEAKQRELQIKRMKSRRIIENLIANGRASRF